MDRGPEGKEPGRRPRLSFTRKTSLALGATALVAVIVAAVTGYALHLLLDTQDRVTFEHERDVLVAAGMRASADRELTGGLGYLLGGDERHLFVVHAARRELDGAIEQLRPRMTRPAGSRLLTRVARHADEQRRAIDGTLSMRSVGLLSPVAQRSAEEQLRTRNLHLDQALNNFTRYAQDELDAARARTLSATRRTLALIVAVGGTVLLLAAVLAWLFTRTLARLYREAQASAAALARERDFIASVLGGQRFLAEAGARLSESLDYQATVERVAGLAVPELADGCELILVAQDGTLGHTVVIHDDPNLAERVREMRARNPVRLDAPHAAGRILATGRPELISRTEDVVWRSLADDDEHLARLRALGVRSYMGVPLVARGRTVGVLAFAITSDRRPFEERDLEIAEELARRAALAIDNAALYRRSQEAITFTGVAAHELRAPISVLQLQAERLLRRADRDPASLTAAVVKDGFERIRQQAGRLTRLIGGLLDATQISAGRLRLELEEVDLTALVREVTGRLDQELVDAGCPLLLDVHGSVVGRWDRLRLEQVVTNLVTNAAKYGRGHPVEVAVVAEEGTARLTVKDHGIGISPDDQARIFESYERAVTTRSFGGHGLGLWISRRIVRAMGGDIVVWSQPGKGAQFVVELPQLPVERPRNVPLELEQAGAHA